MFFRAPSVLRWIYPELTWRIPTSEKEIYLTFDDGPVSGPTDFVLEQLSVFESRATFFCIGNNVAKNPNVFAKVQAASHTIGNHTFDHMNGWRNSVEKYAANTSRCDDVIGHSKFFRPPFGRITRSQIRKLSDLEIIMWDVLTHDFLQKADPEKILKRSIKATRAGSIVVFHDSYKAEKNLKYLLPRYMDHFAGKGFSFKQLT